MIKSVHLKNFESHEDTTISFTDGLNLLIGGSNQGKSSIIRAIALVVANRFDKDCVRTGCLFCEVTVTTERGSVTAFRGEETNRWVVHKNGEEPKEYRNIGTATPPGAMEVLGIGEREHGGISELPNIMFQLEKHYMLSEIDGKKATANQIARMMDDAIGIGGMEDLIKSMADDFAAYRKELNLKADEISLKKGELIDDSIYAGIEEAVEHLKKTAASVDEVEELLERAAGLTATLDRLKESLARNDTERALLEGALFTAGEVGAKTEELSRIERALRLKSLIEEQEAAIRAAAEAVALSEKTAGTAARLVLLEKTLKVARAVGQTRVAPQDTDALQASLNDLRQRHERIVVAEAMLSSARAVYLSAKREDDRFIEAGGRLEAATARFTELRKTLGRCPLCGSELK